MKNIKGILIAILLTVCFVSNSYGRDSNGVTVTDFTSGNNYGLHIDHFTAFNPTSATYIYNEAGESAVTSGEVNTTGIIDARTVTLSVPTLGSTSIDIRLEGRVENSTTWSNLYTKNIAAATTIDIIIPITEYITAYRVGVKVNTNGTDVINIRSSFTTSR